MFDFSFAELLVICVVGLLVLGPKELPAVVRALRNVMRRIKQTTAALQAQINEVLDDDELQEAKKLIKGDDGTLYEAFDLSDIELDKKRDDG